MTIEFIISNNLDVNNNFGPLNNPLAIIYGYIGATKAMMLGYSRVWLGRGFNVLIYYPSSILSFYRKGVVQINNKIIKYFNNPYSSKVLAFHSISSGANCLSYHLKLLYHKYPFLLPCIKACCFDNISTFRNSILNFNQSLKSSGNIFNFLHSLIVPIFIPLWSIHERNDFKYLISKNNKFHYLVIYSNNNNTNIDNSNNNIINNNINNNNNTSKLFIKTLKQKGNQFNEKNSDSDLILIEKVMNPNIQNNYQLYTDSTNQLIDLVINNNNRNIRHIYSKNTLFW